MLYSRRGLSRSELQKNEPKKLKRLTRAQTVHGAAAYNFWPRSSANAWPIRRAGVAQWRSA